MMVMDVLLPVDSLGGVYVFLGPEMLQDLGAGLGADLGRVDFVRFAIAFV